METEKSIKINLILLQNKNKKNKLATLLGQ